MQVHSHPAETPSTVYYLRQTLSAPIAYHRGGLGSGNFTRKTMLFVLEERMPVVSRSTK